MKISDVSVPAALHRVKRVVESRVLKRWGSGARKKAIWNGEFAAGQWAYLDNTTDDPVYAYLEKWSDGDCILDLGCGAGNTGNEIDVSTYSAYVGVDISDKAIDSAVQRSRQNGRETKNRYVCADLTRFVPEGRYQVVLFRESLFYVPGSQIEPLLERYRQCLKSRGVFIVRMCNRDKYASIVRLIETNYRILESSPPGDSTVILVFR